MKMNFFSKKLRNKYYKVIAFMISIESFILIFKDIPEKYKFKALMINIITFLIIYIAMFCHAKFITIRKMKIASANLTIKFGDIFCEKGLKVIPCNEYFDSLVDENIVSSNTLHGKVLKSHIKNINDFDEKLKNDSSCKLRILDIVNERPCGKHSKYQLGTCFQYNDYIFVAFSKFDIDNKAYLDFPSYMFCLSNMWNEINRVYSGNDIVLPLIGSGLTRIYGSNEITKQNQLELLINSLKYSNITFSHDINITIVLPDNLKEELSIYEI